jgi:hypothetical protein
LTHLARLLRYVSAATLLGALSCSLVVDAGCAEDELFCDGACVSKDDPWFGCGASSSCLPCLLPNAVPKCSGGQCTVEACLNGFREGGAEVKGCESEFLPGILISQ